MYVYIDVGGGEGMTSIALSELEELFGNGWIILNYLVSLST